MVTHNLNNFLYYIFLLTLLCYGECKRGYGSGGRRGGHTTPRSNHHTTHNYQRPTEGNIGFERYQPSQNSQNNRQDIGFENVHNRVPPNTQPHGGSPPQYQTHYNPVSNSPSAPLPPTNHHTNPQQPPPGPGIGFENVHQRVPPNQQSNYPHNQQPSYPHNQQPNYPNNQQPNYPHNQQPNNPYNGYNNHQPQYPGSHPGQYNPGHHNNPPYNAYQPPPTYYNPHYSTPGGVPPPIYQPVQQSSGSSILGYAGTFAGGYLIGRLTSGGGGGGGGHNNNGDSGDRQYTVHHYHHDANSVPKQMSVSTNSLIMCDKNSTQGLCVPNTFAICLSNGTIMCVTHTTYTTPCGGGNNLACVITVLPCVNNATSCNTTGNLSTTAVYIPCISNVTVSQQNLVTTDTTISNQNVQYCVTAIAEPKKLESPVAGYVSFLQELARLTYQMSIANSTTSSPVIMSNDKSNKTEMTTLLPVLNSDNKTEITTLPYKI
ncbi:hypothetical protein RI129_007291 [Pyrocoelia pectoralis]|uniref:Uncharacterized protein n=1 Tax=Pyrocoelia pectoralis TaxID=417401 RepID=A0AAN7ZMF7_9COLE